MAHRGLSAGSGIRILDNSHMGRATSSVRMCRRVRKSGGHVSAWRIGHSWYCWRRPSDDNWRLGRCIPGRRAAVSPTATVRPASGRLDNSRLMSKRNACRRSHHNLRLCPGRPRRVGSTARHYERCSLHWRWPRDYHLRLGGCHTWGIDGRQWLCRRLLYYYCWVPSRTPTPASPTSSTTA